MRLNDWMIIALSAVAGWFWGLATDRHLTTDPACVHYREARSGSRLDRVSRGESCSQCLADRAWGREPKPQDAGVCSVAPAGWWCSREPGHDGPCAAHPETPKERLT